MSQNTSSTHNRRFEMGFEILARLDPRVANLGRSNQLIDEKALQESVLPEQKPALSSKPQKPRPWNLAEYLREISPAPRNSILLGATQDRVPILMDLLHSESGSILIWSDSKLSKTKILSTIVSSGCMMNSPKRFTFYAISEGKSEIKQVFKYPHLRYCSAPYQEQTRDLFVELTRLVEGRHYRPDHGAVNLLIVEDLVACLKTWNTDAIELFEWLVRYGPASQVWVAAGLAPHETQDIAFRALSCFGTHVVGRCSSNEFLPNEMQSLELTQLDENSEFYVYCSQEWLRFSLPEL